MPREIKRTNKEVAEIHSFPSVIQTTAALAASIIELPPGTHLIRAVRNLESIWPASVNRTYRFGPPESFKDAAGRFPFFWLYIASDIFTAAWEARLCDNDVTRPGTFNFAAGAGDALICDFTFTCPLRLADLTGQYASKLGIFDHLSAPEYDWSQPFGVILHAALAGLPGPIDGFRYLSRKHPGHYAYAISSTAMVRLDPHRTTVMTSFAASGLYESLRADPCFVLPPE